MGSVTPTQMMEAASQDAQVEPWLHALIACFDRLKRTQTSGSRELFDAVNEYVVLLSIQAYWK